MFDKHYVGLDLTGFEDNGITRPVSRVTLLVDDENAVTAGDDSGMELTADCPHATQQMANAILAAVKGYKYQMYAADAVSIDPAAELGDGVTAGGVYSVISRIDEDGSFPDIAAPGEAEMEDEFPTAGPITQSFNRKIAETRSSIEKTAEEIRLEVRQGDNANASLIQQTASAIMLEVSNGLESVRGQLELKVGIGDNSQIVSMLNASADQINIRGDRFVLDSQNFKVTADGTITAKNGNFESVTINGSTFAGTNKNEGTVSGGSYTSPSLTGTVGGSASYSSPTITGGTLSGTGGTVSLLGGSLSSMGGSLSGATLSTCTTNGTTLTVAGGSVTDNNGASIVGMPYASIRCGNYFVSISSGIGSVNTNFAVTGDFSVGGSKNRVIRTEHFGERLLDAMETTSPTFSDYGMARLDDDGICYLAVDPVFAETVNSGCLPTVFLTKYADGDVWVEQADNEMVKVVGTPGLTFSWEIRFAQTNANIERIRIKDIDYMDMSHEQDFNMDSDIYFEKNTIHYEDEAFRYYTDFERSIGAA